MAHRFNGPGQPYQGLTTLRGGRPGWTGDVRFVPEVLSDPLKWSKPCTVFVGSMSDLFHEKLTDEQIASVFGIMAACPQHTFQVLTKRSKRMREWFEWIAAERRALELEIAGRFTTGGDIEVRRCLYELDQHRVNRKHVEYPLWPLPNVWLGVSVENQATADERIPLLLQCPAAVRFISAEPLLEPVELQFGRGWLEPFIDVDPMLRRAKRLDWVIVGSESGPGARQMQIEWAELLRDQCRAAGVAFFTKQIANQRDRKGGNPKHWPGGPWPREWPEAR
jgi:protein gp37